MKMMCQRRIIALAVLSAMLIVPKLGLGTGWGRGQEALDAEDTGGIIRLDVVVNDKAGNPVPGLKPQDFTLLDNGQRQEMVSFDAHENGASGTIVEAVLLIDSLNLSAQQVATAKSAIAKFLREKEGHLAFPTIVYRLSSLGLVASQRPSMDGNELADEVVKDRESKTIWTVPQHPEGAPRPDAGQARNEASLKALGAIAIEERKRPCRKLLFWVGPGWPTEQGGHYSFEEIVELSTRLREARLSLFSVTAWAYPHREFTFEEYLRGVKSEKDARTGDVSLEVLATKSGGIPTAPAFDLRATIDRLVEHAYGFYTVSFDPPRTNHVDEYHEIKVMVNGRDAAVRTNFEYYDEPSYNDRPADVQMATVEQLENDLRARRVQSDGELAHYLSTIKLVERLDSDALTLALSLTRGKKSHDALISVADQSASLSPPTLQIPQSPAPNSDEQNAILRRLNRYLRETIPNLPNFFAVRTTIRYAEPKQKDELDWKTIPVNQSLDAFGTDRLTVRVRNSKEEVTDSASAKKQSASRDRNLFSEGAFGPIFSIVSKAIAGPVNSMEWSRWEEANGHRLAVFRFAVPDGSEDFEVGFCCLVEPDGTLPYKKQTSYHGEIAVDPQSGVILQIWIEADLPSRLPIIRTGFAVNFGPVIIGGKTYICPIKGIYISRARTVKMLQQWGQTFAVYGPFQTLLNDVTFTNYHIFRSEHRILTGYSSAP